MEIIIIGVSIVLIALIAFLFTVISYVAIRVKSKIRVDTAALFTKNYLKESNLIQSEAQVSKESYTIVEPINQIRESKIKSLQQGSYLDADFLDGYYAIKNDFNYSLNEIVKPFINHAIKDSEMIEKLSDYLIYEKTYTLALLDEDNQKKLLKSELDSDTFAYFINLYSLEQRDVLRVFHAIKELNNLRMQGLQVRLAPHYSFTKINNKIHYVVDNTLAEGFQIINDGRLYDYSIKRSELS